ncbi:MAG TPA: hypothetical protein ENL11_00880, partial [Candidatus Acetothermia bacterium]|nr:hypothetical protein [Candidatus Acetothermia bacterium]
CVVFEDAKAGVEAARRAGMRCVGVATTHSADRLRNAGADLVVPSLAALKPKDFWELFEDDNLR